MQPAPPPSKYAEQDSAVAKSPPPTTTTESAGNSAMSVGKASHEETPSTSVSETAHVTDESNEGRRKVGKIFSVGESDTYSRQNDESSGGTTVHSLQSAAQSSSQAISNTGTQLAHSSATTSLPEKTPAAQAHKEQNSGSSSTGYTSKSLPNSPAQSTSRPQSSKAKAVDRALSNAPVSVAHSSATTSLPEKTPAAKAHKEQTSGSSSTGYTSKSSPNSPARSTSKPQSSKANAVDRALSNGTLSVSVDHSTASEGRVKETSGSAATAMQPGSRAVQTVPGSLTKAPEKSFHNSSSSMSTSETPSSNATTSEQTMKSSEESVGSTTSFSSSSFSDTVTRTPMAVGKPTKQSKTASSTPGSSTGWSTDAGANSQQQKAKPSPLTSSKATSDDEHLPTKLTSQSMAKVNPQTASQHTALQLPVHSQPSASVSDTPSISPNALAASSPTTPDQTSNFNTTSTATSSANDTKTTSQNTKRDAFGEASRGDTRTKHRTSATLSSPFQTSSEEGGSLVTNSSTQRSPSSTLPPVHARTETYNSIISKVSAATKREGADSEEINSPDIFGLTHLSSLPVSSTVAESIRARNDKRRSLPAAPEGTTHIHSSRTPVTQATEKTPASASKCRKRSGSSIVRVGDNQRVQDLAAASWVSQGEHVNLSNGSSMKRKSLVTSHVREADKELLATSGLGESGRFSCHSEALNDDVVVQALTSYTNVTTVTSCSDEVWEQEEKNTKATDTRDTSVQNFTGDLPSASRRISFDNEPPPPPFREYKVVSPDFPPPPPGLSSSLDHYSGKPYDHSILCRKPYAVTSWLDRFSHLGTGKENSARATIHGRTTKKPNSYTSDKIPPNLNLSHQSPHNSSKKENAKWRVEPKLSSMQRAWLAALNDTESTGSEIEQLSENKKNLQPEAFESSISPNNAFRNGTGSSSSEAYENDGLRNDAAGIDVDEASPNQKFGHKKSIDYKSLIQKAQLRRDPMVPYLDNQNMITPPSWTIQETQKWSFDDSQSFETHQSSDSQRLRMKQGSNNEVQLSEKSKPVAKNENANRKVGSHFHDQLAMTESFINDIQSLMMPSDSSPSSPTRTSMRNHFKQQEFLQRKAQARSQLNKFVKDFGNSYSPRIGRRSTRDQTLTAPIQLSQEFPLEGFREQASHSSRLSRISTGVAENGYSRPRRRSLGGWEEQASHSSKLSESSIVIAETGYSRPRRRSVGGWEDSYAERFGVRRAHARKPTLTVRDAAPRLRSSSTGVRSRASIR